MRILDYPLADVLALIGQHLDYTRRHRQQQAQAGQIPDHSNTQQIIYRKADDSWF